MTDVKVGQRLIVNYDVVRVFKQKDAEGNEVDGQRIYHFAVPFRSPYEEVYSVLNDIVEDIKKNEELAKKRFEEEQAKRAQESDSQEKVANL